MQGKFYKEILNRNQQYYNLAMDYNEDIKIKLKEFYNCDSNLRGCLSILKKIDLLEKGNSQNNKFLINKVEISLGKIFIIEIILTNTVAKPSPILIQGSPSTSFEPTEKHFYYDSVTKPISKNIKSNLKIIRPIMILFLITSLALLILLSFFNFSYLNSYFDSELSILKYFHFQQYNAFLSNLTMLNISGRLLLLKYENEKKLPKFTPEFLTSLMNMQQLFSDNKFQLKRELIKLNSNFLDSNSYLFNKYEDLNDHINLSYYIVNGNVDIHVKLQDKVSKMFWSWFTHQGNLFDLDIITINYYMTTRDLPNTETANYIYDWEDLAYILHNFKLIHSIFYLHVLHLKEMSKIAYDELQSYYYILAAVLSSLLILQVSTMILSSGRLNKINESFEKILTVKTITIGSLLELYVLSLSKMECLSDFIINPLLKVSKISERLRINSMELLDYMQSGLKREKPWAQPWITVRHHLITK